MNVKLWKVTAELTGFELGMGRIKSRYFADEAEARAWAESQTLDSWYLIPFTLPLNKAALAAALNSEGWADLVPGYQEESWDIEVHITSEVEP